MFYYINDACFNLQDVAFFTRSKFENTPEDAGATTVYTISIIFKNVNTPLIITYTDENERNNDFHNIREVLHGYGKSE